MKKNKIVFLTLLTIIAIVIGLWIYSLAKGRVPLLDQWTRSFVDTFGATAFHSFFTFTTKLGSKVFLIPFVIIAGIVLVYLYKRVLPSTMFALGTLCSWLLNHLIKAIVERPRPSLNPALDAVGSSFPSGHAMISFVCYGLLLFFLLGVIKNRKARITLQIIIPVTILIIGVGRYLINVHYLTDVAAGYFFGYLFLLVWIPLYNKLSKKSREI